MVALFRALRHRNYRLFFTGQSISLAGTWITRIATSWLVYRLTGSVLLLGLVGFAGQIPTLFLAPVAGVFVDRWDRHRVLVVTQALSLVQSAVLAALTLAGVITVAHILILSIMQGMINAFDTPARQAFVVTMIEDPADLPNAIALNSSMVNGSRIIGPSIGGALIAAFGEGWCFLIDAISYVAVLGTLLAMRVEPVRRAPQAGRLLAELRAGFEYVSRFPPARTLLLLLALVSLMGIPYTVLMPAIARETLGGGPDALGFLMTASGAGALTGALWLAGRKSVIGLGRVILGGTLLFGTGLAAFSLSRNLLLSIAILPFVGAGFMVTLASTNTILQTIVAEELRGRVMAFYTMAFLGTAPLGSLLAGVLADGIGAPATIRLGGIACLAAGAWYAKRLPGIRKLVRPIYVERGILVLEPEGAPQVAPQADAGKGAA